jgi:hypothetical protein
MKREIKGMGGLVISRDGSGMLEQRRGYHGDPGRRRQRHDCTVRSLVSASSERQRGTCEPSGVSRVVGVKAELTGATDTRGPDSGCRKSPKPRWTTVKLPRCARCARRVRGVRVRE